MQENEESACPVKGKQGCFSKDMHFLAGGPYPVLTVEIEKRINAAATASTLSGVRRVTRLVSIPAN